MRLTDLRASSKASTSVLAVDERQSLETLTRDGKTSSRSLAQLKDKLEQQTQKREKLTEEERAGSQKKAEVSLVSYPASTGATIAIRSLKRK